MKQKNFKLFLFILCITSFFYAQSQTSDNAVDVMPHWKKDETHAVKIKTTTTDLNADNGKSQTFLSTFDASFKLIDASKNGYEVEWNYTNAKLADNEPTVESQIAAKMTNVKMNIKLSETGRFVELINVADVKAAADKALDELISGSNSTPAMVIQYRAAKQMISSKQGLEIALLKQIKFYYFSFGYNYKLDYVQTNNIKFPNPMGGQPFEGVEKVQLTKLDKANSTCVIESNKTIDGNAVKLAVTDYVKRVSKADPKTIDEQIGKANLGISENTMQQLDFAKGLVQKSLFKRTVNLGFQNRTTILEIETAD